MTRKDWLQLARIQLRLARALLYRDSLEDGFASFRDPIGKQMRALTHLLNAMQFRENARKIVFWDEPEAQEIVDKILGRART
jgi:hypothetical protein